jgi:hypothetical protein
LGYFLLRSLGSVLGASLLPILDPLGVQNASDDVVSNAGKVLDATAPYENDRVLLKIVTDSRDIGGHLHPVGEPYACDLAQRGVRLLWRGGEDPDANTPFLRAILERRCGLSLRNGFPATFDQLVNGRHSDRSLFPLINAVQPAIR